MAWCRSSVPRVQPRTCGTSNLLHRPQRPRRICCIEAPPRRGFPAVRPQPPTAERIPRIYTLHGETRKDDYFWLRDWNNPRVKQYIDEENRYAESEMEHTKGLQEQIYKELVLHMKEDDTTAMERIDDYFYYQRYEAGKQYPIYCRRRGSPNALEQVMLDANELATGHAFFEIGDFVVSPDHNILAFSMDTSGEEMFDLRFKDLRTGKLLDDTIPYTYDSIAWASDSEHVFYTVVDDAVRPFKLLRHRLGSPVSNDAMLHHEEDERFFVSIRRSRSKQFLFMDLYSKITTETHVMRADNATARFTLLHPREVGIEYKVDHHGDYFYIVHNRNAPNGMLSRSRVASLGNGSEWETVLRHRDNVKVEDVELFRRYMVVHERTNGLQQMRISPVSEPHNAHYLSFPEELFSYTEGPNHNFETNTVRFTYSSLVTPKTVYDYRMDLRRLDLVKGPDVPAYDASEFVSHRLFASTADGKQVPISIVHRKDLPSDRPQRCLLHGYGAYGASLGAEFSPLRIPLLKRDLIYAIAHVRGGGELGRQWYEDGKLQKKMNTFNDFIACAEHLIQESYTTCSLLAASGRSAGGLLMGSVANAASQYFKAMIVGMPFVDVINTMIDPSIPLTAIEWEEWGNPLESNDVYQYMKSYSPYDNVMPQRYPHMLVTSGLYDPRVAYWEPTKWVAKLRATKTDSNILLLKTFMSAGHSGPSGRYEALRELAYDHAFLLDRLGVEMKM